MDVGGVWTLVEGLLFVLLGRGRDGTLEYDEL